MSAVLSRISSMISCAGAAVLPVDELELDHADRVLGDLVRSWRGCSPARV